MSLNWSCQFVFPHALSLLLRSLSSAVRPNPRWSYVKTVMPREAYTPCAHSYRATCSAKPCTNSSTARAGLAAAYVLV
ncbi:hypothetical protein NUW54_g11942 [Trametes sanguinea]|uniref:Uncharacterized protein n=1 Tax=Trametes sanguinea TaxID=158606 RepID=A0ACC1N4A2_9APHY|nr:hypothetical protein NUW54_g11942 [Trametes sanguinea]